MNNICPICWDKFDKINYYYLPCNHIICHKCYIIFIKQYTNCCLCRSPFEPDMVKEIRFIPERHGKNWTNIEEFSLIDLYLDSQSINRIAKKLQRTEEAIISKLEKLRNSQIGKLDELRRRRLENKIEEERLTQEYLLMLLRDGKSEENKQYGYYFAFTHRKFTPLIFSIIVGYGIYIYSRFL